MTSGGDKGGPQRRSRNQRSGNAPAAGPREKAKGAGYLTAFMLVAFVLPVLWGLYDEGVFDGRDEAVETAPFFGPRQVGRLVEQLSTAADAQGVCYGWVVDSDRSRKIKQVTPSYPGTFRPRPPGTPAPSPGAPVGASPSAAPRPGSTGTPPATPAPAAPSPEPTRGSYTDEDIRQDLEDLDNPGMEYGSNLGPGMDPRRTPARCSKWVVLEAEYIYWESSQEWRSGSLEIKSSFDDFHAVRFDDWLGQRGTDDISGPNGVARLRDAVGALPMLVAEEGLAPPVPARTPRAEPPAGDEISEAYFTERNIWKGIGVALIASGIIWVAVAWVRNLRRNRS